MYKNMRFILKQDKHLYQFQLTVFSNKLPDIFRYVKSEFHIPLSDEQYDKTLHNRAARVEHLKPGGVFANICSLASQSIERTLQQLDDKPCTTGEYLAYYDAQVAELETAGKRFPLLKEVIARRLKESSLARAKLKEFFDEYGAGPNDSLLAPQFKALSQGTILETYHKIKAATMPCAVTMNSLKMLTLLFEQLEHNPRIFFICGQSIALPLYADLKQLAFAAHCYGNLQGSFNSFVSNEPRFTHNKLATYIKFRFH